MYSLKWRCPEYLIPHDPKIPNCLLCVYFLDSGNQKILFLYQKSHYSYKMLMLNCFSIKEDFTSLY